MYPQVTQIQTHARLVREELQLQRERNPRPASPARRRRFALGYALRVARR